MCSLYVGSVDAEGKHTPGLLALAYQRLAETRGLAAATQVQLATPANLVLTLAFNLRDSYYRG